jgi:hypothetical protein
LLALLLDLSKCRLRSLHALKPLACRPLPGGPDPLIAGRRVRLHLVLEFLQHRLRHRQMAVERAFAPERGGTRTRPYPHAVLH